MGAGRVAEKFLFRYLDTNGNGTGTKNAIGDYSDATGSGATDFYIQPSGQEFYLTRLIVLIGDAGAFDAEDYGNGAVLTNGINVKVTESDNTEVLDLLDGEPILNNVGWGRQCYDVDVKGWGTGDEFLLVRWTFERAGAALRIPDGFKFKITLHDKVDVLTKHYFQVQGWID